MSSFIINISNPKARSTQGVYIWRYSLYLKIVIFNDATKICYITIFLYILLREYCNQQKIQQSQSTITIHNTFYCYFKQEWHHPKYIIKAPHIQHSPINNNDAKPKPNIIFQSSNKFSKKLKSNILFPSSFTLSTAMLNLPWASLISCIIFTNFFSSTSSSAKMCSDSTFKMG